MGFSTFAIVLLSLLIITDEIWMAKIEDLDRRSNVLHKKIAKRLALTSNSNEINQKEFYEFVEENLVEHSQALEHLVKLVHGAVNDINAIAENMNGIIAEPKLPEKINIQYIQERSDSTKKSRRSFSGQPSKFSLPDVSNVREKSNQWCSDAVLCNRTMKAVCGYDDNYGYGKFDDICHMIKVNCYWDYNFTVAPNCRPTF